MKKCFYLLALLAVVMTAFPAHAQDVRDKCGTYLGRFESNGSMHDKYGIYIGKIDSDGYVRDKMGTYVGKVEKKGSLRDRYGKYMGKVENISHRQAAILFFFEFIKL